MVTYRVFHYHAQLQHRVSGSYIIYHVESDANLFNCRLPDTQIPIEGINLVRSASKFDSEKQNYIQTNH